MASNLYERSISGTVGYVALSDDPLVLDVTIIASSKNTANVTVRFLEASGDPLEIMTAQWPPGAVVHLRNVDLSKIAVAAPSGQLLLVVGQAP